MPSGAKKRKAAKKKKKLQEKHAATAAHNINNGQFSNSVTSTEAHSHGIFHPLIATFHSPSLISTVEVLSIVRLTMHNTSCIHAGSGKGCTPRVGYRYPSLMSISGCFHDIVLLTSIDAQCKGRTSRV